MPREILTPDHPEDHQRPVAGFFGKLPATGDFVARGLSDSFRQNWDTWLTRHVAPLQREGRTFPPGGLRFRLPSGGRLAAGVILPSQDSAGRLFPLSLLLIADGDLLRQEIDAWCDAALALQPDKMGPEALWHSIDALPAPRASGAAMGTLQLWIQDCLQVSADATDPSVTLLQLLPP